MSTCLIRFSDGADCARGCLEYVDKSLPSANCFVLLYHFHVPGSPLCTHSCSHNADCHTVPTVHSVCISCIRSCPHACHRRSYEHDTAGKAFFIASSLTHEMANGKTEIQTDRPIVPEMHFFWCCTVQSKAQNILCKCNSLEHPHYPDDKRAASCLTCLDHEAGLLGGWPLAAGLSSLCRIVSALLLASFESGEDTSVICDLIRQERTACSESVGDSEARSKPIPKEKKSVCRR